MVSSFTHSWFILPLLMFPSVTLKTSLDEHTSSGATVCNFLKKKLDEIPLLLTSGAFTSFFILELELIHD